MRHVPGLDDSDRKNIFEMSESSEVSSSNVSRSSGTASTAWRSIKAGSGNNGTLAGFVATGDASFGAAFASSGTQTFPPRRTRRRLELRLAQLAASLWMIVRLDTGAMLG